MASQRIAWKTLDFLMRTSRSRPSIVEHEQLQTALMDSERTEG